MVNARQVRAKLNIVISLAVQAITLLCSFVIPQLMISAFGSEAYGATSSISQFLAYITLLEGGIGGVARAALYKPLADNDTEKISAVVEELRRFFRVVAYIFLAYVLILACSFTYISDIKVFDWITTFLLVIIISISTFAQYFIGVTYSVLLQAAQKVYITNLVSVVATILNTVLTVILVKLGYSLLIVKLVSSCIFVLRPLALQVYVKRHFSLISTKRRNKELLNQKWTGLGQHIAFFLHSNTDIMVLTVLANLTQVAVYSVYNMIIAHIQSFAASFSSGMEALFGDMIAKQEYEELNKTFSRYETLISTVSVILFTTTAIMIMPFIKLYTAGITDAEYHAPLFAVLMVIASLLYCLRIPYHSMTIAAGHFKQTKLAAYGEAIINIGLSIILVRQYGLMGVAIGTVAATAFRFLYYVGYLSKNIVHRKISLFIKRMVLNVGIFTALVLFGKDVISVVSIDDYLEWAFYGAVTVLAVAVVTVVCNYLFYKKDLQRLFNK